MPTYCPRCYGRKIYCRRCKTTHCGCHWNTCPPLKKGQRKTAHQKRMEETNW